MDTPANEIILPAGVEQEEEVVHAADLPAFVPEDYELPADIAALIEDDEEDDWVDPEPVVAAEPQFDFEVDDDDDPRLVALARENAKLTKRADHERKLRVQSSRKAWETEAKNAFRLGPIELLSDEDIAGIKNVDSKREFMRKAKTLADNNKRIAQRFAQFATLAPSSRTREQELAEQREEWGPPATAGNPIPAQAIGQQERLARARRSGNLKDLMKAHIYPDAA